MHLSDEIWTAVINNIFQVHEVLNTNKQLKILTNDLQTTVSRNKTNYEIANKILLMENENLKTLAHSYQ